MERPDDKYTFRLQRGDISVELEFTQEDAAQEGMTPLGLIANTLTAMGVLEVGAAPAEAPVRQRSADYAVLSAKTLRGPFTPSRLLPVMTRMGWQTRSRRPNTVISTVISRDRRFRKVAGGWVLAEQPADATTGH